jgi:D-sedoheptulose 7-phosphate isomerase
MSVDIIQHHIDEHRALLNEFDKTLINQISEVSNLMIKALSDGNSIYWCGNGGSSSDSQHLAAELVGRYHNDRIPLRSVALNSDTSVLTCIANDYGYKEIFARQVEMIGNEGDVLVGISTSGNSENILLALQKAKTKKMITVGFLGKGGGKSINDCDNHLIVPSNTTARIQEMHIMIGHILCDLIEHGLNLKKK